jgi:hypothetical protein
MPRLLLGVLAATLALAAPAGAEYVSVPPPVKAPACHRRTATPRVVATRTSTAKGRAAIVACDHASGHRKTLRRGYVGTSQRRLPLLSTPAVQGTKVIWSELDGSAKHPRQDLRTADVRRASHPSRRRIGPSPAPRHQPLAVDSEVMQVLALPRGALAYVAYADAFATRLVLERPGHAPQRFMKEDERPAFIEDGRTLVWFDGARYRAFDVAPLPRDAAGCPVRSAYRRVVIDTSALRVSLASYDDGLFGEAAIRVCWKASGHDDVASSLLAETYLTEHVVANGPFVALTTSDIDRYQSCSSAPGPGTRPSRSSTRARAGRRAPAFTGRASPSSRSS